MPKSDDSSDLRRTNRGPLLIIALALLLVGVVVAIVQLIQSAPTAGAGGPGATGGGPPPAAVFVSPVMAQTDGYEARVTGTLRAVSRADIAAQEQEAVAEVRVDDGDQVTKGDLLVRLDGRRVEAQVKAAEAALKAARNFVTQREAELTRARSDLEMNRDLLEDRAISRSEFLDAEREFAVNAALEGAASQAVLEAESRLELLAIRRRDLQIVAPFDGVVVERNVEPGEWVSAGQSVVTLVTIDPLEAWMSVPERYLGEVTDDPESVRVILSSSGEVLAPVAVTVVPDVAARSQLFTVVATLENPGGRLAPGQSITGRVSVGEREKHLVVPVDALVRARAGDAVFVEDASGEGPMPVARKVPVAVHFERDGFAFIRAVGAGLTGKDRVVVEGNDRLQPGQPLMVREADAGPPDAEPPPGTKLAEEAARL